MKFHNYIVRKMNTDSNVNSFQSLTYIKTILCDNGLKYVKCTFTN